MAPCLIGLIANTSLLDGELNTKGAWRGRKALNHEYMHRYDDVRRLEGTSYTQTLLPLLVMRDIAS